jgi:four helix bundle protein
MQFQRFEDIKAWQESRILVSLVFRYFSDLTDFDFRRQLFRATLSTMNNIAEGYERRSNKEFAQFLFISKGSCGEVRSMMYAALDLGFIDELQFNEVYSQSILLSKITSGLIKSIRNSA